MSYVLQDQNGQVAKTHSISAGLDYPSIGPEHAFLHDSRRVSYTSVDDQKAINGFQLLAKLEGIIPALESAHAVAYGIEVARDLSADKIVIVNLSGRGDKDVNTVRDYLENS
jgi:tryptophan synthase beta chain